MTGARSRPTRPAQLATAVSAAGAALLAALALVAALAATGLATACTARAEEPADPAEPGAAPASAPRTYRLVGPDGQGYGSPEPGRFGGNRRSRVYGDPGAVCRSALRQLKLGTYAANRVWFARESDAIAAGYRPCRTCQKGETLADLLPYSPPAPAPAPANPESLPLALPAHLAAIDAADARVLWVDLSDDASPRIEAAIRARAGALALGGLLEPEVSEVETSRAIGIRRIELARRYPGAQTPSWRIELTEPVAAPVPRPADPAITELLRAELGPAPFTVPAARARSLARRLGIGEDQLLVELAALVREQARAPISGYAVGIAARARGTGNVYLGVNLEFAGADLGQTVHGEQFAVALLALRGERGVEAMAFRGTPCGHCRQFLYELREPAGVRLLLPGRAAATLGSLLPLGFGPESLGQPGALLDSEPFGLDWAPRARGAGRARGAPDALARAALQAARRSYAPYTRSPAGVALETRDGRVFAGFYLENAAFNPGLSPLQVALAGLVAAGAEPADVARAVFVELPAAPDRPSQEARARALLAAIAPQALFEARPIRVKR